MAPWRKLCIFSLLRGLSVQLESWTVMNRAILALALLVFFVVPPVPFAAAEDGVGMDGTKLRLNVRRGTVQKLMYVARGDQLPFPELGGANDPRTAGVNFEIFTAAGQRNSFTIRTGPYEGASWRARDGKAALYKYKNKLAPAGQSFVNKFLLKRDKVILVSRSHDIDLLSAQQAMLVRLTMGDRVLCSYFDNPIFDGISPGRDSDATSFFSRTGTAPEDCLDSTIETMLGVSFD